MTTRAVTFGAFVPQGWKMELAGIDGAAAQWAKAVEIAEAAEALGYDSVWVYDHVHNVPVPAGEAVFECWTTLAAISQRTSRVRLGQMVGCASYRNPALLAKVAATVDVISGGRLDWGIGAGWYRQEYEAYGYPFPPARDRIAMLGETVEIVRSLWTEPETSYQGRHFTVTAAQCDPKPLQSPRPPILVGGGGEQLTLRVVARLADRSNFGGNAGEFAHKCDVLRRHCDAVGRDYDDIEKTWAPEIFVRETDAEVRAIGGSTFGEPFESWQAGNLVGTPEQVIDRIGRYREMGVTAFLPWCRDYPSTDTLTLVAERVIPAFR
ncbi:MAG TPA: TIGR03560 family F420-dependent LLM class oxidoreductase [Acidimicrobiales bacterium]|nr:TIGR03560 family F420-dependent LLM class oxidoreductase [Acidimicrobiales bacterium]